MKSKYLLITTSLLLLGSILTACSGGAFAATSWPGLTVASGNAFLAYNTQVYAFDASNGSELWHYPEKPDNKITFYATPALTPDGQLIIGGFNNILYSFDPSSGQINWQFSDAKNRYIGGPLVTDKGIYAPNADKNLYALDLKGQLLWTFPTKDPNWAQPALGYQCNCLYLTSMDHFLYAINVENGSLLWQSKDLDGAIVGTPAVSQDGTIYIGTFANEMVALNAQDGSEIWRAPIEGWVWSGPTLNNGKLYFGDLNGNFYALNATDGKLIWQLKPDQLDGSISGTPLVIDNNIYFTTQSGTVYDLDTDGKIQWQQVVGGKLYGSPLDAGDLVLIAPIDTDNILVALTSSGAQQWAFNPNPPK